MDNQKRTENAIDRAEAMTKMLAENVKSDEEDIYIKVSAVVQLLRELSSVNSQHSGDLISREKTLTAFADYVGSGMSMDDYDALWNIVAKMPAVNPTKTSWIPVTERLPKVYDRYLISTDDGMVQMVNYGEINDLPNEIAFHLWDDEEWQCWKPNVTAWMPLPAPYEPQERSDKE